MAYFMYVAVQGDNKISVFTIDPESGNLTPEFEVPVAQNSQSKLQPT